MHFLGGAAALWALALGEDNVVSTGEMLETSRSRLCLPVASGRLRVGAGGRNRHGDSQTRHTVGEKAETRMDVEEADGCNAF